MTMATDTRIEAARVFLDTLNTFLENQPPADDLDASSDWLIDLNAHYSRWAQVQGDIETMYAQLVHLEISGMDEDEFKKIKNSSTLTDLYIKGKYHVVSRILGELQNKGKVLAQASENTRTLLASWRQEQGMSRMAEVRNTTNP